MDTSGTNTSMEIQNDESILSNDSFSNRSTGDKINAVTSPKEDGDLKPHNLGIKLRPPSPAPYALYAADNSTEKKYGKSVKSQASSPSLTNKSVMSPSNTNSAMLRAPYAQPVLDASKLQANKKASTSVDERIASVRERRLHQQQIFGISTQERVDIDAEMIVRRAKDDATHTKWEQTQEERRKKMDENREKENMRRKVVEERKNKQVEDDKKRAEAIVARTDQQVKVVLRRKRKNSVDKSKRWSWGAGGYGGGGGGATHATHIETAPSPFHYFDPTRLTKRLPRTGLPKRRPISMDFSRAFDMSKHGEGGEQNTTPSGSAAVGPNQPTQGDDKFSKSPLVMSTSHMAFASGLRSYDSSPAHNTSKSSSPASSARQRRARSLDPRPKSQTPSRESNRKNSKESATSSVEKRSTTAPSTTRGRSPALRSSPNSTRSKVSHSGRSPQLTEPGNVSSSLMAPTRSSIARSAKHDNDDLSSSSAASIPLRSLSADRKYKKGRPSSAKSDTSSNASTISSARSETDRKSNKSKPSTARAPSPAHNKGRSHQRPSSPSVVSSKTIVQESASPKLRGDSTHLKSRRAPSPASTRTPESKDVARRRPSPARRHHQSSPASVKSTSADSMKTPSRADVNQHGKSTPPAIKPSLRPNIGSTRPKSSLSPASTTKSIETKMQKKEVKNVPKKEKIEPRKTDDHKEEKHEDKEVTVEIKESNISSVTVVTDNICDPPEMQVDDDKVASDKDIVSTANDKQETVANIAETDVDLQTTDTSIIEMENQFAAIDAENENSSKIDNTATAEVQLNEANEAPSSTPQGNGMSIADELNLADVIPDSVHEDTKELTTAEVVVEDDLTVSAVTPSVEEQDVIPPAPESDNAAVEDDVAPETKQAKNEESLQEEIIQQVQEPGNKTEENTNVEEDQVADKAVEISNDVITTAQEELQAELNAGKSTEQKSLTTNKEPMAEEEGNIKMEPTEPLKVCNEVGDKTVEQSTCEDHEDTMEKVPASTDTTTEDQASMEEQETSAVNRSTEADEVNEEVKVKEVKDEEIQAKEDKHEEAKDEEVKDEEVKVEEVKVEEVEVEEVKVEEVKDEEVKVEEVKDVEVKVDEVKGEEVKITESSTVTPAPEVAQTKKKEKKLTPEEQAYKDTMAAKRREMKEKREREEKERQERKKLEAEEQVRRTEAARRMAEEARLEHERYMEEERKKQEEIEMKKRQEAEEVARKHEEHIREQREKLEQKAKEEAEKVRKDREIAAQKKDEERLARKKRLEMIMRRTRGGESPTRNASPSSQSPSGEQSPANATPTGGRSPYNSLTPDRMASPVNVDRRGSADAKDNSSSRSSIDSGAGNELKPTSNQIKQNLTVDNKLNDKTHEDIENISLEVASNASQINGNVHAEPQLVAFDDNMNQSANVNGFTPISSGESGGKAFGILQPTEEDPFSIKSATVEDRENGDAPNPPFVAFEETLNHQIPTGNLLDL